MQKLLYAPTPEFRPRSIPTPQTEVVAADESPADGIAGNVLFVVAAACILITVGLQIVSLSRATAPKRPATSASVGLRAT
jgi:hypothetical protein